MNMIIFFIYLLYIFTIVVMSATKYIGYWRRNDLHQCFPFCECYKYPIPVSHDTILDQAEMINKSVQVLDKFATTQGYRGYSPCRLCPNKRNGFAEYSIGYNGVTYIIPMGYFHYLRDHNVKIDDELVEIVEHYFPKLSNVKYIGYWRTFTLHECSPLCKCRKYPIPYPHDTPLDQADIIERSLHVLQSYGKRKKYYDGYSECRLCGFDRNGDSEIEIQYNDYTYVIPDGYFHYLDVHNVKIDDELVAIVEYYENE